MKKGSFAAGTVMLLLLCGGRVRGAAAEGVKIVLVGDSTVNPGGGWGKGFCEVVTKNVTCINEALNGRSSKSFLDEGAWAKALADQGNYYLIQFGHNDQKPDAARHTDAATTYRDFLRRYVREVRENGGVPVLVTSLSRRNYRDGVLVQDLTDYAEATRRVAAEEHVEVIDLNAMSVTMLRGMTQVEADGFDATGHEDAKAENQGAARNEGAVKLDRTHLNAKGQKIFGEMVAAELVRERPELRADFALAR